MADLTFHVVNIHRRQGSEGGQHGDMVGYIFLGDSCAIGPFSKGSKGELLLSTKGYGKMDYHGLSLEHMAGSIIYPLNPAMQDISRQTPDIVISGAEVMPLIGALYLYMKKHDELAREGVDVSIEVRLHAILGNSEYMLQAL